MFDCMITEQEYMTTMGSLMEAAVKRGDVQSMAYLAELLRIHEEIKIEFAEELNALQK